MDNIAHTLAGLAVRDTAPKRLFENRTFFWIALLVANMPDIDIILWLFGPTVYFDLHRGITHSVFSIPVWGAIGAAIAYFISRRRLPFFRVWLLYSIIVIVHLILDWVTSYGTELFSPFDRTTYSLHLFPIVDIWSILVMTAFAVLIKFYRTHRRTIAIIFISITFIYTGFRAGAKMKSEGIVIDRFGKPDKIYSFPNIESLDTWVNPTMYRVVTVTGDSAISYEVSPLDKLVKQQGRFDLFGPGDSLWNEVHRIGLTRAYLRRSELPIRELRDGKLFISDLRYISGFGTTGALTLVLPIENGEITGEPEFARPKIKSR